MIRRHLRALGAAFLAALDEALHPQPVALVTALVSVYAIIVILAIGLSQ